MFTWSVWLWSDRSVSPSCHFLDQHSPQTRRFRSCSLLLTQSTLPSFLYRSKHAHMPKVDTHAWTTLISRKIVQHLDCKCTFVVYLLLSLYPIQWHFASFEFSLPELEAPECLGQSSTFKAIQYIVRQHRH